MPGTFAALGARSAGLGVGIAAVVVLTATQWRVPAAPPSAGARIELEAVASGEIGIEPAGRFLTATRLVPGGDQALGSIELTNQTGGPQAVRLALKGELHASDRDVRIRVLQGGHTLLSGMPSDLRKGARPLRLSSGATVRVRFSVRIDAQASKTAWTGRSRTWQLVMERAR